MLLVLPPSETKVSGGDGPPLDVGALAMPALRAERHAAIDAVVALSADPDRSARALKITRDAERWVGANAAIRTSPTLPAVDRYTGVLFDALGAGSLPAAAREWLRRHALVHTALLGPIGALDPLPEHRLSAGTSVPGLPPLTRLWREAVRRAWAETGAPFVLDARSEAYAALGPIPGDVPSAYLRVLTRGENGRARALNHFNKKAKGELTRALAETGAAIASVDEAIAWGETHGFALRAEGAELALYV